MDEELARWAKQWQSQEERQMKVVAKHLGAHQSESISYVVLSTVFASGGIAAAALLAAVLWLGEPLLTAPRLAQLLLAIACTVFGLSLLAVGNGQRARARALLVDTPESIVRDLLLLRERELFWWTDKRVLTASALWLALCVAVIGVSWRMEIGHGVPPVLFWTMTALASASLVGFGIWGVFRVRFLRGDVRSLEAVLAEMVEDLDGSA